MESLPETYNASRANNTKKLILYQPWRTHQLLEGPRVHAINRRRYFVISLLHNRNKLETRRPINLKLICLFPVYLDTRTAQSAQKNNAPVAESAGYSYRTTYDLRVSFPTRVCVKGLGNICVYIQRGGISKQAAHFCK